MLSECVVNISEGRDLDRIDRIAAAAGSALLDVHTDWDHHRSVLTLGGELGSVEEAARSVVEAAVAQVDLRTHQGAHPRLGAADVVPFVPLAPSPSSTDGPGHHDQLGLAIEARNRLARWAGSQLDLPCFLYGPERSLPDIRRTAFRTLEPDTGPPAAHPTAGASAVGARGVLVAYNVWIVGDSAGSPAEGDPAAGQVGSLDLARRIAARLRGPAIRSLGLGVGMGAQVSCNLIDPGAIGVAAVYDAVAREVERHGGTVERAELVGLLPAAVLASAPRHRWAELDLDEGRTIEARLAATA